MLIGGQDRSADQQHPGVQRDAPCGAFQVREQPRPDDDEQDDVQRRCLVEWLVEAGERVVEQAEEAVGGRPLEREAQRHRDEEWNRDRLREAEPAFLVDPELAGLDAQVLLQHGPDGLFLVGVVGFRVDLLDLDLALSRLAEESPARAELVKLRFFTGLTVPEAAKVLGISVATAERYWTYARTRLFLDLSAGQNDPRSIPTDKKNPRLT